MASVRDCTIIRLPEFVDERGSLSFVEGGKHIPFDIARIYYLFDMPTGARRGAHAHREISQLMIPIKGSFDVVLDDGKETRRVRLNQPCEALLLCPMIWRDLENFSPDAVCLVLASGMYDEAEYFRDYHDFIGAIA